MGFEVEIGRLLKKGVERRGPQKAIELQMANAIFPGSNFVGSRDDVGFGTSGRGRAAAHAQHSGGNHGDGERESNGIGRLHVIPFAFVVAKELTAARCPIRGVGQ